MKTYTFPYGTGEWDATIDIALSDKDSAVLEASMKKEEYFHMEDDPALSDIERKVSKAIIKENKRMMIEDGRLAKTASDDAVYDELGNYRICLPNAF